MSTWKKLTITSHQGHAELKHLTNTTEYHRIVRMKKGDHSCSQGCGELSSHAAGENVKAVQPPEEPGLIIKMLNIQLLHAQQFHAKIHPEN